MGFFKEFYENGTVTRSINTTFLVLIPKRGGVEDLKGLSTYKFGWEPLQTVRKGVGK